MRARVALTALALALAPSGLAAKQAVVLQRADAVKDKPSISLEADRGYVFFRSDATAPIYLMRDPSPEDLAAYEGMRAEALVTARERYAKALASHQAEVKAAAKQPSYARPSVAPFNQVEPTEANFAFTPFHLLTNVGIGPLNRFSKGEDGASSYLHALTPGKYRIYGAITSDPNNGPAGTCFCMGSVRFTVGAGEVVDLGMIVTRQGRSRGPSAGKLALVALTAGLAGAADDDDLSTGVYALAPVTADMAADPRLSAAKMRPADYRPSGKVPNYFGITIDRLPEIPGVMRYDRDRIVDLTADK